MAKTGIEGRVSAAGIFVVCGTNEVCVASHLRSLTQNRASIRPSENFAAASREGCERMDRRRFVVSLGAASLAGSATMLQAQPVVADIARIGVLGFGTAPTGADPDPSAGFFRGMRELGYEVGRNLEIEVRYADGRPDKLAALTAELLRLKPNVIFAGGPATLHAARHATSTIPIVTVSGSDPVGEGWAQSLARPGGNVTGLTVTFPELAPKRLELFGQAFPGLTRMAVLLAPAEPGMTETVQALKAGGRALGFQIELLEVSGPADLEAAFKRATSARAQGLYAVATNLIVANRTRLADLSLNNRLPSMSDFPLLAEAGFLMSYGADLDALSRRAAAYVDKILKGARPGDLPIERPNEFELVINRKTARSLGVTLPQTVLLRAHRMIE